MKLWYFRVFDTANKSKKNIYRTLHTVQIEIPLEIEYSSVHIENRINQIGVKSKKSFCIDIRISIFYISCLHIFRNFNRCRYIEKLHTPIRVCEILFPRRM